MVCTLQIDAEILRYSIPYKYVIHSPVMENQDDCYEHLHGYRWNPNRCLQIAKGKYQQAYGGTVTHDFSFLLLLISCCVHAFIGTYHQYDTVVYPKHIKTSRSLFKWAKETAKSVGAMFGFGSSSQEGLLSPFEMGKLCLQVYLEGYKEMLCSSSFPKQVNLQTIVEEVCHIFNLLYYPIIFHQTFSTPSLYKFDGKFIEVCLFVFHFTNHCMAYSTFSLLSGNEGMAGVCCRCLAE